MTLAGAQDLSDQSRLVQALDDFHQNSGRLTNSYQDLRIQVERPGPQVTSGQQTTYLADQLSSLLELLPAGVILIDEKGRIDRFNQSAVQLLKPLSWGRRWSEIYEESLKETHREDEWLLKDGRLLTVAQCSLATGGHILVLLDVTEERQLEARLQHQQRLSSMGEMVARMAHQVRTPLSTAILYAGQLSRATIGPEQRIQVTERLLSCLRHIESMVGEMLSFSRRGTQHYLIIDLGSVLQQVVDTISPRLSDQQAAVVPHMGVEGRALVTGHQDGLIAVLLNLVENALQHGGEAVEIHIALDRMGEGFLIQVTDDGPGIPEELREQIFDPFFTTDSRGTGLGLAVAQTIVKGHGGMLECCEHSESGACFLVWLPETIINHQGGSNQ